MFYMLGFINHELQLLPLAPCANIEAICSILDSLQLARRMHPGQKNNLDALCRRYNISNEHRTLHGALLDSEILADVYLAMTGGQIGLQLGGGEGEADPNGAIVAEAIRRLAPGRPPLKVVKANNEELVAHGERLVAVDKASGGAVWLALEGEGEAGDEAKGVESVH